MVRTSTDVFTISVQDWSSNIYVAVKCHFSVSEYLMGSGSNNITAIMVSLERFDSQQEAEDGASAILAKRNTALDGRDTILFLREDDPNEIFSRSLLSGDEYFLTAGGDFVGEAFYSLSSRYDRQWLPAAGTTTTGDRQEFLLAVPEPGITSPTITLGELKRRVAYVDAELNGGDGSEAYRECIQWKYIYDREQQWQRTHDGRESGHWYAPRQEDVFVSGQASGAILYEYREGFADADPPEAKAKLWIDGQDSALFAVELGGLRTAPDWDRDGQPSGFVFDQRVVSERPIPAGTYKFNNHFIPYNLLACSHTYSYEMMIDVVAAKGVLHELLFDPTAVGTDDVFPAESTVGETATEIAGLEWSNNKVVLTLDTHVALSGYVLDFIVLDGTVSLSLLTDEGTVDSTAGTYSWSMTSQPWENGDKLMVRIREG